MPTQFTIGTNLKSKMILKDTLGKRVYFCGNGGSAADAQHLSAELSGRYYFDRPPLPSEALHVNGSYVNVVKAFEVARELGMYVVAFTGEGGGAMAPLANMLFAVPSKDTPRIQEAHMLLGHTLCQGVEETLFS